MATDGAHGDLTGNGQMVDDPLDTDAARRQHTHCRVALVTGGHRGIGRAVSERLAADGFAVAVNYRADERAADEVVAGIRARGGMAAAFRADVCVPDQVTATFTAIKAHFGASPAVVVNNVGEFDLRPVVDTSPAQWHQIIESNLNSAFYVTHAALSPMRAEHFGRIVFIGMAPTLELRGAPSIAAYAVAKTGVAVMARTLAVEEAAHGITVNCIAPGLIDTGYLPPEQAKWMQARVPMGRLGRPDEVADAISYVISDRANYVSGATLSVSGAWDWQDRPVAHDDIVSSVFVDADD